MNSVTAEEQRLTPALSKATQGIREFADAVDARLKAGTEEWPPDHLADLQKLRLQAFELQGEFYRIMRSTR